jgi:hypothetical protein
MQSQRLPAPLALHLGAVGLAGGSFVADGYQLGALPADGNSRVVVTVMTPLVASFVGFALGRTAIDTTGLRSLGVTIATTLGAGVFVGVVAWSRYGITTASGTGLVCALAFLPAVGAVVAAARRVGRARPGSVIDRADRRTVLLATATSIALGSIAALPQWNHFSRRVPSDGSLAMCLLALAGVATVLATEVRELVRFLRVKSMLGLMMPTVAIQECAGPTVDVGLGDEMLEQAPKSSSAYRQPDRPLRRVIGDVEAGAQVLTAGMGRAAICLVVTAMIVAFVSGDLSAAAWWRY